MATLAADKPRAFENNGAAEFNELPIIADDIVFLGAAVGESSSAGTARPLEAGDTFLGFAEEKCDNAGGSAADKNVKVRTKGYAWLTVANIDNIDHLGDAVYASDDDTFTTVSTGNTQIGKVARYDASRTHKALVKFEAANVRSI